MKYRRSFPDTTFFIQTGIKNFNAYYGGVNLFNYLKNIELPSFGHFEFLTDKELEKPDLSQKLSEPKVLKLAILYMGLFLQF